MATKVITHVDEGGSVGVQESGFKRKKLAEVLFRIEGTMAGAFERHLDNFIQGVCLAVTVYLLYHLIKFII